MCSVWRRYAGIGAGLARAFLANGGAFAVYALVQARLAAGSSSGAGGDNNNNIIQSAPAGGEAEAADGGGRRGRTEL